MPAFELQWRRMREYPTYEVSNTGRFRTIFSKIEVRRNDLGTALLYHIAREVWIKFVLGVWQTVTFTIISERNISPKTLV